MISWSWSSRLSTRTALLVRSFLTARATPPLLCLFCSCLSIHSYPSSLGRSPFTLVSVMVIMWLLCIPVAVFRLSISSYSICICIHYFQSLVFLLGWVFCAGLLLTCLNLNFFGSSLLYFLSMSLISGWGSVLFSCLFLYICCVLPIGLPLFCCHPCRFPVLFFLPADG